jgi:hypothetical protein
MEHDQPSKPDPEQRTEREITVREVTHHQIAWSERRRGEPGAFTIQLILDHGADEYVLRPTAQDTEVLAELLSRGARVYFDLDRKVLMFGNQEIAG